MVVMVIITVVNAFTEGNHGLHIMVIITIVVEVFS